MPLVLLVLLAAGLDAQAPAGVAPGTRVRVLLQPERAADGGWVQELRGEIGEAGQDTLTVRVHTYVEPVAVPVAWIDRLYVSRGPASAWQGARSGAVRGLAIGAAIGGMIGGEVANSTGDPLLGTVLVRVAAYGFSLGATGAILGAMQPGERWQRVPVRPTLAVVGSPRGTLVGVEVKR